MTCLPFLNILLAGKLKDCFRQRKRLLVSSIVDIPLPECDSQGNYKTVQCSYAWGFQCWCVNTNGNAYWTTSVRNGSPNCSERGITV